MVAKKKVPTKEEEVNTQVFGDKVPEVDPAAEAKAIKERIEVLKADRVKNQSLEAVQGLLNQLPTEKTAKEHGVPVEEYAARVMASQSPDVTVVPPMLGIAKTRKALKKQGYELLEIETVIDNLEKAYDI